MRISRRFFAYGFTGGIFATIVLLFATRFLGLPYPPEAIFQALIEPVPGSIQSVVVEVFHEYAKYAAFATAAALYALMYAFVSVLIGHLFHSNLASKSPHALVLGTSIPTMVGLLLESTLAARASILDSSAGWLAAGSLILAVNLAYSILIIYQPRLPGLSLGEPASARPATSRRRFLTKVSLLAVALVVGGFVARIASSLLSREPLVQSKSPIPINSEPIETAEKDLPDIFRDPRLKDLVDSEVTNNRIFYRVDIDPLPPQLDLDRWSLKVQGKVKKPFTLDMSRLTKLPTKDEYATLECVSNTIYPPSALISNAKWTGVPLAALLNEASASSDAKYVVFRCADGYSVGIPIDRAMQPGSLLAYKMNGETLPSGHGFPLRAVVPGIYGMMNAKWITEIEVVDYVYFGYWQQRGWSNDARIKTTSLTYYPPAGAQITDATLPIAGIAFAGERGISKVEVSTDGGDTWNGATLKKALSPYSWVIWAYKWAPTRKGAYNIVTRAHDGAGKVQDARVAEPFPEGASGYHSIKVTVT